VDDVSLDSQQMFRGVWGFLTLEHWHGFTTSLYPLRFCWQCWFMGSSRNPDRNMTWSGPTSWKTLILTGFLKAYSKKENGYGFDKWISFVVHLYSSEK
jgi:hypothetical protein